MKLTDWLYALLVALISALGVFFLLNKLGLEVFDDAIGIIKGFAFVPITLSIFGWRKNLNQD